MDTDATDPFVALCRGAVAAVRGDDPGVRVSAGGTDAGLYSTYDRIPVVVLGPGDIEVAHKPDEHVAVTDLRDAADIYAGIARGVLGATTPNPEGTSA
jgi:acetylornithine deacetylase/succinyl-diaminopimelate desuccinylase